MKFQFFSEKIEFSKLNLKIEFHEPPNGSWKVLGCNTDLGTSHIIQDSRLRVDVGRIREMIQLRECEVEWINKDEQLADPLTKAGASPNKLLEVLKTGKL